MQTNAIIEVKVTEYEGMLVNNRWYKPARANPGVKILVLVVVLIIIAWWVYILKFRNQRPVDASPAATPQTVSLLPIDPDGPDVRFPDSARCDNKEVNDFIISFLNSLLSDDYKSYRLKVTQQREPINQKTFDEAYGRVKTIEVKKSIASMIRKCCVR